MTTSMIIARLLLPVFAVVTVAMFIRPKFVKRIVKDLAEHAALLYIVSIIQLIGGTAILMYHNTWSQDWSVIITLIGWFSMFKGVFHLLFSKSIDMVAGWVSNKGVVYIAGVICALFTIALFSLSELR